MSTPPENLFKRALTEQRPQIGLWMGLADPYCAEICAGAGFDWLLIDNEHAPNDLRTTLAQLQAIAAYDAAPVVRPVIGETHLIKQYLDIGVRNLLIPMVDTPEQAAAMVAATRYPPRGVRGVGSALARASAWNRDARYVHHADDGVCLLVQIESVRGLENLEQIAATEGVDGIFIGPADLAASMGHTGNVGHPDVQGAIEEAFARIRAAGKPPGILVSDETAARRYLEIGGVFVAVGVDATLLARETTRLARTFKVKAEAEAERPHDGGRVY